MGLRGPAPQPTAIKDARGNPGRRPLNANEPIPPRDPVVPPRWLTPAAMDIWHDLAPHLIAMRVLTVVDRMTFARYCRTYARYLELQENFWDKGPHGTLYPLKDKKGKTRNAGEWPQAAELRRLQEILCRLEDRFGLNPAARSRLHVTRPFDASPSTTGPQTDRPIGGPFKLFEETKLGGPKPPRQPIPG